MPDFEVRIENMARIQAKLKKFPEVTEKHLQRAISLSGAAVHKGAVRGVVPWKTGNLVQSFGVVLGRLYASIAPNRSTPAKYAIYVHEGTRPHIIRAKTAKGLFWKGAAHPVKQVKHPGTKPNRFMPRILKDADPKIQAIFKKALASIIEEISSL